MLAADQLVAGPAGVGDAAAEGLALAVHVTVRDLLGLAAPDRCKTRIKSIGLPEESTHFSRFTRKTQLILEYFFLHTVLFRNRGQSRWIDL